MSRYVVFFTFHPPRWCHVSPQWGGCYLLLPLITLFKLQVFGMSCSYTRTTSTKAARVHTDEMKADADEEHVQAASEVSHVSLTHVSGTHVSGTRQQSQGRHSFPKADAREEHVHQVQQRSPVQRTHKGAMRSGAAGWSGGGDGGWGGRSRSGVGRNESLLMSATQALVHLSSMNFDLAPPPPPERDTPRSPREPVDAEVDAEVRD
jgi:hypothetical protein